MKKYPLGQFCFVLATQQPDSCIPLGQVVESVDPRIHFALVCGAKSCPPIKLYTPENLDEGLDAAGVGQSRGLKIPVKVTHFTHCSIGFSPRDKSYVYRIKTLKLYFSGEAFCSGEVQVDRNKRQVNISKIFKVYNLNSLLWIT